MPRPHRGVGTRSLTRASLAISRTVRGTSFVISPGAVADRAEITEAEAKRVLEALEDVVIEEIAKAEKVKIVGSCSSRCV